ncbi:MAG: AzlC family ABC transporter permease [Oscillospiraceae bacterium]|nr:AzlC family ABC transporter permease [Oscillospiraceae bacterium]
MKELRFAVPQTIPVFFTYLFIGIAFGVLMDEAGFSAVWTVLAPVLIYAGSAQLVMVPMLAAGTSLLTLAVTVFFINARHVFYGIAFLERFRGMGARYPYMVFSLTDETYSILCSVQWPEGLDQKRASFLIALLDQCYWVFGCAIGACVGSLLKLDLRGIDFSATAFFLVVVVNQWRQSENHLPAAVGLVSAVALRLLLGAERFLIPALLLSLMALLLTRAIQARKEGAA